MADLAGLGLSELVTCCGALRDVTTGASSMEEAATRIVRYLRASFTAVDGRSAFVLARLFTTERYDDLPAELQRLVLTPAAGDGPAGGGAAGGGPAGSMRCLTLLGTDGDQPAWCDRHLSVEHQVIPLASVEALHTAPMIAALVRELGVDVDTLLGTVADAAALDRTDFDVFHVPVAAGSGRVPAQRFVAAHGVASVLGFGGMLPTGQLFTVVLFARVQIDEPTAQMFRTVAVSTKLALLPVLTAPLFAGGVPRPVASPALAQARIVALQQMLTVHESTAAEQTLRLRRETEIIETLHRVGVALGADLDLDRVVAAATDAAVEVTGAAFGAFARAVEAPGVPSYRLHLSPGTPAEVFEALVPPPTRPLVGMPLIRPGDVTAGPRHGRPDRCPCPPSGTSSLRSYLAAPVVSPAGDVHGVLFLGHPDVGVFDERAERLTLGITAQTAIALDNAAMYRRARRAALELQRHLLPGRLSAPAGVQVAHRYLPGAVGVDVGGDWYDLIGLPAGRVAVVIGDVMGRGMRAAATMGQLRTAVRAYAALDLAPAAVMRHLNELLLELAGEQLVTCIYAVLDPATGSVRLANAGHLPPAVREAGGAVTYVDVQLGLPLGVQPGTEFGEHRFTVAPGAALLLFTDGLVERRNRSLGEGLEQLRAVLEELDDTPEAVCDKLLAVLTGSDGEDDDTALLLLRRQPTD